LVRSCLVQRSAKEGAILIYMENKSVSSPFAKGEFFAPLFAGRCT
jgi:hypothetical protein